MSNLSQDQIEKRASIQKGAMIWGVILGVIAGLLAIWILGSQGGLIRFGGGALVVVVIGALVNRAAFNAGAKSAKCENCGAAFSRARSDRQETLANCAAKESRDAQDDGTITVTTWTEEVYDVVDTYSCAKCGDVSTKSYQTTRRKDETSTTEKPKKSAAAEPIAEPTKGGKGGKSGGRSGGSRSGKK